MAVYGYSRVSTLHQDLAVQSDYFKSKGLEPSQIYGEKESGKSAKNRDQLQELIKVLKSGDTLFVYKLDRFSRSTVDTLNLVKELSSKGVIIEFGDVGRVDNTPTGQMILTIFSAVAELERSRIIERTQAGRAYKKEHDPNYKEGRKKKLNPSQINEIKRMREAGKPLSEIANLVRVSRKTLYNYLNQY